MNFYDEAFKAAGVIMNGFKGGQITGRAADGGISLAWVAQMALNAGAGDHCEIGTLFGASAMVVALAKKLAGVPGAVYCIDPFPKERKGVNTSSFPDELKASSPQVFEENIQKLNAVIAEQMKADPVEIHLVRKPSQPWPLELENKRFVSAYIDGDHAGEVPWLDFKELAKRTDHYIGFDNFEEGYPDVEAAVMKALTEGKDWRILFKNSLFIALRKAQPPRNTRMASRLDHI
jgi:hypothetical protein